MNYGASGEHTMQLDRTDTKILRALQEDARRSFRELARRVGVSVPTVSAHVANLERRGETIQGGTAGYPFRASVDDRRLFRVRAGDRRRADHPSSGGPDPLPVLPVMRATVQRALLPD